jgi:hypothetical protein
METIAMALLLMFAAGASALFLVLLIRLWKIFIVPK